MTNRRKFPLTGCLLIALAFVASMGLILVFGVQTNLARKADPIDTVGEQGATGFKFDNDLSTTTLLLHTTSLNQTPELSVNFASSPPAPLLGSLTLSSGIAQVGIAIEFTAVFTDPPLLDVQYVFFDWGDGSSTTIAQPTSPVSSDHTYTDPGVFIATITIGGDAGEIANANYDYLVVYDPEGGFVTGGGWIDSPPGAYQLDPTLAGKATFGFVSKYKKGATAPDGSTEFQFQAGGFNFHSDLYDWLVVNQAGTNAQLKGSGAVNGALAPNGNPYKFMLWAGDGSLDTFRIKIWFEDAGEVTVYDNGIDQVIGGGSIIVHGGH